MAILVTAAMAAEGDDGRPAGAGSPTTAPATRPAAVPVDAHDQIALTRTGQGSPAGRTVAAAGEGLFTLGRVSLALGVVLACIFVMRWASGYLLGMPAAGSGGAIQVLSRTTIAPRQQLMLVQVGRRVVLVANCGAQMNPLCEISDPDEIAAVVGQIHSRKSNSAGTAFLSLFAKATATYDQPVGATPAASENEVEVKAEASLDATRQELSGLLEKVRSVSQSFRRT